MLPDHLRIEQSFGSLAAGDLDQAEARLGTRLPDSYRRFLLRHNGGRPEPAFFCPRGEDRATEVVDWFLGLGDPDYGLLDHAETYREDLPPGLLPIACDPFGNLICLRVAEEHGGGVFFWNHEGEPGDEERVRQVAESFEQFLASFTAM